MSGPLRVCAVVCLLVGAVAVAGVAAASHDHGYTDFETTPGDRTPGAGAVDYRLAVEVTDEFDGHESLERPERILFAVEGTDLEPCAEGRTAFADLPHSLYVDRPETGRASLDVEGVAWDGDAALFGLSDGEQPAVETGDTLVLELDGCVAGPDTRGWYRSLVDVEGETPDGESASIDAFSHYFGVCEGCGSRADAGDALGPPPSEPDPTPNSTTTPTSASTTTPTPTPTAPTPTVTPTVTSTLTPTVAPTSTPATPPDGAAERPSPETGPTPSVGDGAGFSALAALAALVVALARHR